jgi:alkylation response protein AidB-like acyl-CoA dehydrogenase
MDVTLEPTMLTREDRATRVRTPNPEVLTSKDCTQRARVLAPKFAERAQRTESQRRLMEETVSDFVESGLVRALLPRQFGGSELDFEVVLNVCLEIGRACGSSAWVGSFFMNHAWVVGLFPHAAQDEVWGKNPNALIATRVSFFGGNALRTNEGFLLSGRWSQTSGVDYTEWFALCANEKVGDSVQSVVCLIPRADISIEDTWYSSGLKGSGSKTVVAENVFVPNYRTILFRDFMDGTCPGGKLAEAGPLYRLPGSGGYVPILAGPILGASYGALEGCVDAGLKVRGGPGSLGPAQRATVAEAAASLDAATLLLRHHLKDSMETVCLGRQMNFLQRARGRRDGAFAAKMANGALTKILDSAPASVLYEASSVQRAWRDVRMMSAHPALHADTGGDLWTCVTYDLPLPIFAAQVL